MTSLNKACETAPQEKNNKEWVLADFDYVLPENLIAQNPAAVRSASRLLDGRGAAPQDRHFFDLPDLLQAGDLLLLNDTQVLQARLFGRKPSGGRVELLVERVLQTDAAGAGAQQVVAHLRSSKKPALGTVLTMDGGFQATLLGRWPEADGPLFLFAFSADAYALMQRFGHLPLPPYITHSDKEEDHQRYQTVFAKVPGAVAAPTAALHFDAALLAALQAKGVKLAYLTLHVGAGTFQPVKTERIAEHAMHHERFFIPESTIAAVKQTRANGGNIVAVGTTVVRSIETWGETGNREGDTNIFIQPGREIRWVDQLITNFHLPKSSLLMLVSAFAGHEKMHSLYAHAIAQQYRFFSYGDAMLLNNIRSEK